MKAIAILGCGGHAAVVRDACESIGFRVVRYVVEEGFRSNAPGAAVNPYEISRKQPINFAEIGTACFALGIGTNEARLWWAEKLLQDGAELPAIVHARAWVSPSAALARGVFVNAGGIIQAGVRIQQAALINTNATVEHHCYIGAGAHVGPGAVLAGLVTVGDRVMVGAGATIKDRVTLGNRVVVGAGAAVIGDVADDVVVVGVPAKPLK